MKKTKTNFFWILFGVLEAIYIGMAIYGILRGTVSGNDIFGALIAFAMWTAFSLVVSYGVLHPGSITGTNTSANSRYHRASYEYERAIKNGDSVSAAAAKSKQADALADIISERMKEK